MLGKSANHSATRTVQNKAVKVHQRLHRSVLPRWCYNQPAHAASIAKQVGRTMTLDMERALDLRRGALLETRRSSS